MRVMMRVRRRVMKANLDGKATEIRKMKAHYTKISKQIELLTLPNLEAGPLSS